MKYYYLSSQHLNNLLEYYLEPLKRETFLSNAEITALFGNIQEIVTFQRQFLNNLEEALDLEPDFHQLEHPSQFKVVAEYVISIPMVICNKSFLERTFRHRFSLPVLREPLQVVFLVLCKSQQSSESAASK